LEVRQDNQFLLFQNSFARYQEQPRMVILRRFWHIELRPVDQAHVELQMLQETFQIVYALPQATFVVQALAQPEVLPGQISEDPGQTFGAQVRAVEGYTFLLASALGQQHLAVFEYMFQEMIYRKDHLLEPPQVDLGVAEGPG
jgi:hypothetical protein